MITCKFVRQSNNQIIGDELALDRYIYTNRDEFISYLDTVDLTLKVQSKFVLNSKENPKNAVVTFISNMHEQEKDEERAARGVSTTKFWDRYDVANETIDTDPTDTFERSWKQTHKGQDYEQWKNATPEYNHIGDAISLAVAHVLANKTEAESNAAIQSWVNAGYKDPKTGARKKYLMYKDDTKNANMYATLYSAAQKMVNYLRSKFGNDCEIILEQSLHTRVVSDKMLPVMKALKQADNGIVDTERLVGRVDITVVDKDGNVHTIEMKSHSDASWSTVDSKRLSTHKYQVATYDLMRRQRNLPTTPYLLLMTRNADGSFSFNSDDAFLKVGINETEYVNAQEMIPVISDIKLDNIDNSNKVMVEVIGNSTGITNSAEVFKRDVDAYMHIDGKTIRPVTADMKELVAKKHKFFFEEWRHGRKTIRSAATREELRPFMEDWVKYLNERAASALTVIAKEFKHMRNNDDLISMFRRNGYHGQAIDTMVNHLQKYVDGWTLEDNLALISNGVLLFRKGNRSEIVMFTESKSLFAYHKFGNNKNGTTILGMLHGDDDTGSANTQILSAQYGNIMLIKAAAIISDNPSIFANCKISSISAINPQRGEVLNTISNKKLIENWKLVSYRFKKLKLPLIDHCFYNDVEAGVYRAKDWVSLLTGKQIANSSGTLRSFNIDFKSIGFDASQTIEAKKQIKEMINIITDKNTGFGAYSDNMDYRLKRALAELNEALLALNGYNISSENDVKSYFDQGFTMTGAMMAPFYRSNSANLREFSRIATAFNYKMSEEIQKVTTPFQVMLEKVLKDSNEYSDFVGGEHVMSEKWFVKDGDSIHKDFRVIPPYDPSFPGTAAEAELLNYVLETFASWRWPNTDWSYRKADPTSQYYQMPIYESGWLETIDTSDDKLKAVISLGKKRGRRILNLGEALINGQEQDITNYDDPAVLNRTETPDPFNDRYRREKLEQYGPDVFTKNIDLIFLYTAATAVKRKIAQDMLPTFTAFRQLIHFMNAENKSAMIDIERAINRYIGTVIFDRAGVETSLLAFQAVLQVFRQAFSVFTLGLNSKNLVRDLTSSHFRTAINLLDGRQDFLGLRYADYIESFRYIVKNGDAIFTSHGRLNQLNLIHRMANMSYREIAGQLKKNKFALKNADQTFLFLTSTGSDFLHRMAFLTTYLKKIGAYDAYVEDENGIVTYDMTKDERFKILYKYEFGAIQVPANERKAYDKARTMYLTSLENWKPSHPELKYGDALPLALDPKQENAVKNASNTLYGAYDKEEQALVHSTLLGGAFFQFKTYGISRLIDWWRRPGQVSIIESKTMLDENGEELWEIIGEDGTPKLIPYSKVPPEQLANGTARPFVAEMSAINEGRLQTMWALATTSYAAYYKNDEAAKAELERKMSDPISRANIFRTMGDMLLALIIQGVIRIAYPEEERAAMTEQDWWTRWSHAVLVGVAQDGPVWEVFKSVWGGGEIPVVNGMSRWITSVMGVINGDNILPALANTWGATREFSGMLKDL